MPCRFLLLALLCLGSLTAQAQGDATPASAVSAATPAQALQLLDGRLDTIRSTLKSRRPDIPLAELRGTALSVQDQARQVALDLAPQMAAVQAQLDVLGPAPAKDAPAEAAAV
ncbi:MAG: mechanosensitive ion channel family protein, partial [Rhodanobacter sp.]